MPIECTKYRGDEEQYEILEAYLKDLMLTWQQPRVTTAVPSDPDGLADDIYTLLTGRRFCYLSKARTLRYKESAIRAMTRDMAAQRPLRFYLDIGGGYHASLRPGREGLRFHVGLGELFILAQIRQFCDKVSALYEPGARFDLVIDNMCATLINDIPLHYTQSYCESLQTLIAALGVQDSVGILVESEHFSASQYDRGDNGADVCSLHLSEKERSNIARFLGRPCGHDEAAHRAERYRHVTAVSEKLLDQLIDGVHMTQRATDSTLCFRAFPGADSRIQCGEVGLTTRPGGKIGPLLLTSDNLDRYDCVSYAFPGLLPDVISEVLYAEPRRER